MSDVGFYILCIECGLYVKLVGKFDGTNDLQIWSLRREHSEDFPGHMPLALEVVAGQSIISEIEKLTDKKIGKGRFERE